MTRAYTHDIIAQRDGLLEAKHTIDRILRNLDVALRRAVEQDPGTCPYCEGTGVMTVDERVDDDDAPTPVWVSTEYRCCLGCERPGASPRAVALACDNIPF